MLKRVVLILVAVVLFITGAAWLALQAPITDDWRRNILASALADGFGRAVRVDGPVRIVPGRTVRVRVGDVHVSNAPWAENVDMISIDTMAAALPLCVLVGCPGQLTDLVLVGLKVNLEVSEAGELSWRGQNAAAGEPRVVPLRTIGAVQQADDFALNFIDRETGWTFESAVTSWRAKRDAVTGSWAVESEGAINGLPLRFSGRVDGDNAGGSGEAEFAVNLDGMAANLSLISPDSAFQSDLSGRFHLDVGSAKQFFTLLGLDYEADASGTITADLAGDARALTSPAFGVSVSWPGGVEAAMHGRVGNLWEFSDTALELAWSRPLPDAAPAEATSIYDVALLSGSARVVGDLGRFQVDNLVLLSNYSDVRMPVLGPVDLGTIHRDGQGRLVLPDLDVVLGPTDEPVLHARGRINDVLRGHFAINADIDVNARFLLDLDTAIDAAALGRARGTLAVTRDDTRTRVTSADIAIEDTDLLRGNITTKPWPDDASRNAVHIRFVIDDYARLATALRTPPRNLGTLAADVALSADGTGVDVDAALKMNEMPLKSRLRFSILDHRVNVAGIVAVPVIDLGAVGKLVVAGTEAFAAHTSAKTGWEAKGVEELVGPDVADVRIDVLSDAVVGAADSAENIRATAVLERGVLSIDPLALSFLDGALNATVRADLMDDSVPVRVAGTIQALDLARLFPGNTLGFPIKADTSSLFSLSASLASAEAFRTSLNGTVSAGLRDGWIGTNALEVAGIGVVSFLFSRAAREQRSDFRCALARVAFENGVGTVTDGVFETAFTHASINGTLDVADGTVDLLIESRPLDRPEAWSYIPARISGPLAAPQFQLEPGEYRHAEADRTPITQEARDRAEQRVTLCNIARNALQ